MHSRASYPTYCIARHNIASGAIALHGVALQKHCDARYLLQYAALFYVLPRAALARAIALHRAAREFH
eukprot:6916799-Lingulodinium_polyedra.AAC.1